MKKEIYEGGVVTLIFIGLFILAYGLSWIATCGVIKLITMCFGWIFKWSIATGIWLVLLLMSSILKPSSSE